LTGCGLVELGSGASGLGAVVSARLGATAVATDGEQGLLELLRRNLALNHVSCQHSHQRQQRVTPILHANKCVVVKGCSSTCMFWFVGGVEVFFFGGGGRGVTLFSLSLLPPFYIFFLLSK
jgi:hypothetical protein